ncbi:hypothetical protein A6V39_01395 [Candidatus Mycoplasma haematobovis]|uniref:Uncharacterized protein n=1 Tax=Candidatus Mycoplasma haematobovis TaxID=432608 RepID=A0A1A9QG47_9MOLU|nr:hypothetical protein [Candidatus Mycoplasma haematobovis]OAL10709.1 hypothetical protein A6V39_01395 [Candidatus Mycoplasma haematobovis]
MLTFLNELSVLGSWEAYPSAFFNVIAGTCLFLVMFPDLKTVIKTKKNFSIPTKFFASLFFASFILLVHACFGVYGVSKGAQSASNIGEKIKLAAKFIMMGVFLIVNLFGTVANYYQLKVKLDICKKAKAHNMGEAEYWEKHIQPTLGVNSKQTE